MRIDWAAIEMILSLQFWRMAVYWTLTLLYCYLRLLIATVFQRLPPPMPRVGCSFSPDGSGGSVKRPICIITGATSGLGASAARALAAEGYHVLLG